MSAGLQSCPIWGQCSSLANHRKMRYALNTCTVPIITNGFIDAHVLFIHAQSERSILMALLFLL